MSQQIEVHFDITVNSNSLVMKGYIVADPPPLVGTMERLLPAIPFGWVRNYVFGMARSDGRLDFEATEVRLPS